MKIVLLAATALAAMVSQASAYMVTEYTAFAPLASIYAPIATTSSGSYDQDVTTSVNGVRRSPFIGTAYAGNAFDAVRANGTATFSVSAFGGSNGALGTFAFIFGSPDSYNTLTFKLGGNTVLSLSGNQIGSMTRTGYYLTEISDIGSYDTVTFGSSANSFEFAALSPVPLPASAPMFGAALIALASLGYVAKRKQAVAAA